MGMTIGQGLILGAQNYVNAQERERQRRWEDELRQRQRKEWAARDTTMAQLANADKEQVMGDVPAENWQDPPITQRRAALDPQQLYERQQRIMATSEDPALMTQGIGMYPQVEQSKELAYQRNERAKANDIVKQYSDMRSVLLETLNGVKSGAIAPEVFLRTMSQAVGFKTANSLVVTGLPGKAQYMVTDAEGKGQFAPITLADALKLGETADEYLRSQMENALSGVSAKHWSESEERGLKRQQVGATVMSAEATMKNAGSTARLATVAEQKAPSEIRENDARAAMYGRLPKGDSSGNVPLTKEEKDKLAKLAAAYEAAPTQAERQKIAGDIAVAQAAMSIKRGVPAPLLKDPGDIATFRTAIADFFKSQGRMPTEQETFALAEVLGLPVQDPIMDAIRKAGGLKGPAATPTGGGPAPKQAPTPADRANAEAQALAGMARYTDAELQAMIVRNGPAAPYAQRELDFRKANPRPQAIATPPYVGTVRPGGLPAAR